MVVIWWYIMDYNGVYIYIRMLLQHVFFIHYCSPNFPLLFHYCPLNFPILFP